MNIQERMIETEQLYEQKKAERNSHIEIAEQCLTEMTKLQGEYRLLQNMEKEEQERLKAGDKKASKRPVVAEAEKVEK